MPQQWDLKPWNLVLCHNLEVRLAISRLESKEKQEWKGLFRWGFQQIRTLIKLNNLDMIQLDSNQFIAHLVRSLGERGVHLAAGKNVKFQRQFPLVARNQHKSRVRNRPRNQREPPDQLDIFKVNMELVFPELQWALLESQLVSHLEDSISE